MNFSVQIPDAIVANVGVPQEEIPRSLLEAFAVRKYQKREFTAFQVGQMLGHESRWETDAFLKQNECYSYTIEDLEEDRKTLDALLAKRA